MILVSSAEQFLVSQELVWHKSPQHNLFLIGVYVVRPFFPRIWANIQSKYLPTVVQQSIPSHNITKAVALVGCISMTMTGLWLISSENPQYGYVILTVSDSAKDSFYRDTIYPKLRIKLDFVFARRFIGDHRRLYPNPTAAACCLNSKTERGRWILTNCSWVWRQSVIEECGSRWRISMAIFGCQLILKL